EKANAIESLPSWHSPTENTLLFQAFEWHVPATPNTADKRSHWRRLQHALPAIHSLGVTSIWIPPGCKGMDAHGNGYDIYDLYDLGEFDQKGAVRTKWGTRGELEDLVRDANALGVGVLWDAVLNHKAGADSVERFEGVRVDDDRRDIEDGNPQQISGWTSFTFPGRGTTYSPLQYHWQHFSGVDWDDAQQRKAIYKILDPSRPDKNWAQDVGTDENGNYDYLMFADLDFSHPEVREDVLRWGKWIMSVLPLSGMRLDAAKHFSTAFQREFIDCVRQEAGDRKVFVIGEYWSGELRALLRYLEEMEYRVAAVDVPLVERFSRLSRVKRADLRGVLRGTLVESRPGNALQPGQMLETIVEPSFKPLAYALILLRQGGHPCVFYGDLYGTCDGDHPPTPACEGQLPNLMRARKLYAYGEQQDYFDQPNCIGFIRYGNAAHPSGLACVMSNGGPATKRMYVGRKHAGEKWTDLLQRGGDHPSVTVIDEMGYGEFPVQSMRVSVWVDSAADGREGV
ncbi:alpha-amylase, partial [Aspergillus niger ATCC 1015]